MTIDPQDPYSIERKAETLLDEATKKAWNSLAHGKFSLFGYWAAKVVQFRELLGKSSDPSPFRELTDTAKIVGLGAKPYVAKALVRKHTNTRKP